MLEKEMHRLRMGEGSREVTGKHRSRELMARIRVCDGKTEEELGFCVVANVVVNDSRLPWTGAMVAHIKTRLVGSDL